MEKVYLRPLKLIQAYGSAPWRSQLLTGGIFIGVVVIMAMIAGVYLSVSARASNIGREIQTMKDKNLEAQRIIADLETQYALLTSTSVMEKRARDLGMVPVTPDQIVYVTVPGYIRPDKIQLAPPTTLVTVTGAEIPEVFTQTLIDWVRERVAQRVSRGQELP